MMAPRSGGTPTEYRVTSASLTYLEHARTATYTGAPAVLRTADSETRAATIVLGMAATARRLESLDATTNVVVTQKGGRSASGHRLRYDAAKDQYTLEGTPLTLQMTNTDGTCSIAKGNQAIFVGETGTPDFPAEGNPRGSTNTRLGEPCRSLVTP
jgi:lipopolysaccharide export system protein LptA